MGSTANRQHTCPAHPINSGVPQDSPVSHILFIIYLSGVFGMIERRVIGVQFLSFADDIGLLAPGYSVREVCDKLQGAAKVVIEWANDNVVQFDAGKNRSSPAYPQARLGVERSDSTSTSGSRWPLCALQTRPEGALSIRLLGRHLG